jgi:hypothetical protein
MSFFSQKYTLWVMVRLNGVGFMDRGKLEVGSNLKTHRGHSFLSQAPG